MSDDVECPYCGAEFGICHDDGHGYAEDEAHRETCVECGKEFVFFTSILYLYTSEQADCLNGGKHDWKPTATYPKRYTKMECCQCWERRNPTDKELATIMGEEDAN